MKIRKRISGFTRILHGKKVKHPSYERTFNIPNFKPRKISYGKGKYCRYCGASNEFLIKRGNRMAKRGKTQRYHCYWCGRRFTRGGDLFRMRHDRKLIEQALKLRKQGNTLRDIEIKLGKRVSHTTILRWTKKWTKINKKRKSMK